MKYGNYLDFPIVPHYNTRIMGNNSLQVLVIGLDGAPYHMLDTVTDKMPCIHNLMEHGASGMLQSTIPALSLLAWPVFYTGKNSGKIGVYVTTLNRKSVEEVDLPTSHDVKEPAVWEILSKAGKRVGVVNIPVTYPPKPVNGFMITGFMTPPSSENYTYPAELKSALTDYTIDLEVMTDERKLPERDVDKRKLLQQQYDITEKRAKACLALIRKYEPEFFVVNFKGLDNMQHLFWHEHDVVYEYYAKIDKIVERFIDTTQPVHVMLMSDHGFHSRSTKYFHINTFLEQEGFLYRNKSLKGKSSIFLYNFGVKVVELFPFVRNLVPERAKSNIGIGQMKKRIDWKRTAAYADFHRGIFINRDVVGSQYDGIIDAIIGKMRKIVDPENGKKVFQVVRNKKDVFNGPYFDVLPDIIWLPNPDYRINANLFPKLISKRLDAPHISGEHMADPNAILVMHGPHIQEGYAITDAHIMDLTPTILHLMGVSVPSDMDGKVLTQALHPSQRKVHYYKTSNKEDSKYSLSEQQSRDLEKRLKGLGYL